MKRISCKYCGKEVNLEKFLTCFYCTACGQKNEIKLDLDEKQININNDKYIKSKSNLHKAYVGRNISEIMENCHKVLEICPDDFFADFLLSYCYFRKGNNLRLKNFFKNFTFNDITEEELKIILSEITKDNFLYEEKCEFINKLYDHGLNVDEYLSYCQNDKTKEKKEKNSIFDKLFKLVNNISFVISLCLLVVLILTINNNFFTVYCVISVIVLIINQFLIIKNNYSMIQVILTIFFSFAVYVCVRLLLSLIISKSYQEHNGISFKKVFMGEVKK